jgi:hypothetical protein
MAATVADVMVATRTILSGGGEELVELTKTNLRELDAE